MQYRLIKPSVIQGNLMNNPQLILQFLDLYEEQIPRDLQALKGAVLSGVYTEIINLTHHIKPTMEYIGAQVLREKLQQLENDAKTAAEISDIQTLWADIEREIQLLLLEIADYRNRF